MEESFTEPLNLELEESSEKEWGALLDAEEPVVLENTVES